MSAPASASHYDVNRIGFPGGAFVIDDSDTAFIGLLHAGLDIPLTPQFTGTVRYTAAFIPELKFRIGAGRCHPERGVPRQQHHLHRRPLLIPVRAARLDRGALAKRTPFLCPRRYLTLTYFRRTRGRGSPAKMLPNLSTAPNSGPLPVRDAGRPP